jgi:hypothetical protein
MTTTMISAEWVERWPAAVAARAARPRQAGEPVHCRVCDWSLTLAGQRWQHQGHIYLDRHHQATP